MDKNCELELYKLIMTPDESHLDFSYISEFGWINDKEFCVWVGYIWLDHFMNGLKEIFGNGLFEDGGFNGNMREDCVCIDLCSALDGCLDIEDVFPKEKYKH